MKENNYQLVKINFISDEIDWQLINLFRKRFDSLWDNLKDLRLGYFNASIKKNADGTFEGKSTLPKIHRLKGLYVDYRLFYLQNERTNIFKIMNYLSSLTTTKQYHNFIRKQRKNYISKFIENNWIKVQGKRLVTKNVLDLCFNAEIFHNDEDKVKRLDNVRKLISVDLWKFIVFMAVYDTSLIIRNIHWSQAELTEKNLFLKMTNK